MDSYDNAALEGFKEIIKTALEEFETQPEMRNQAVVWEQEYSFKAWQAQRDIN